MKNTKRIFEIPQIEAVFFELEDIITVSGNGIIPDSEDGDENVTHIVQW